MAYDYTRDALLRPTTRPVFVGVENIGPFQASATDLSPANAWWLANMCHLSYYGQEDVREHLLRVGLDLVAFFDDRETDTQAFLASGPGFAILVFRGTDTGEPKDLMADLKIRTRPLDGGPEVHRGFLDALDGVWTDMRPLLADLETAGTPVWLTGHSLGAALATLAAARSKPAALYTYGSPRVGEEEFSEALQGVPHERFVNCSDIVTQVPPPIVYRHVGRRQFFTATGMLLSQPTSGQVGRARLVAALKYQAQLPWLRGWVVARKFADHSILNYIESTRRAQA